MNCIWTSLWLWMLVYTKAVTPFDYCCLDCHGDPHALCFEAHRTQPRECLVQYNLGGPVTTLERTFTRGLEMSSSSRNISFNLNKLIWLINTNRELLANESQIANMEEIVWDNELRKIALGAAQTCGRVQPLCLDTATFTVTSMIYNLTSLTAKPEEVIYVWNNRSKYGVSREGSTTKYNALALPSISRIGCAVAEYQQKGDNATFQLTCLFGPADHMYSSPLGVNGTPCSSCPQHTNCSTDGLLCIQQIYRSWNWDPIRTQGCTAFEARYNELEDRYISANDEHAGVKVRVNGRQICHPIVLSDTANTLSSGWMMPSALFLFITFKESFIYQ